jgi:hypothetical protein
LLHRLKGQLRLRFQRRRRKRSLPVAGYLA